MSVSRMLKMLVACIALLALSVEAYADELYTTLYGGVDGYCGAIMANGDPYDCSAYTAATNVYDLGTELEVCLDGCVKVEVTDRCGTCGLDLSLAAAAAIGVDKRGPIVTEVTVL